MAYKVERACGAPIGMKVRLLEIDRIKDLRHLIKWHGGIYHIVVG